MAQRALFLDRDGTLVHPRHYPSLPSDLVLYDGIEAGLRLLQESGMLLVVITNQSGLARKIFDLPALQAMHDHLRVELGRHNIQVDAIYFCPHHPEGSVPELAIRCDCRKPAPGMLLRAAQEHAIDLSRSWFVGDILDDVEAGNRAGCRTVLVDLGTERPPTTRLRTPTLVARNTAHALAMIAAAEGLLPDADMSYRPETWEATPA